MGARRKPDIFAVPLECPQGYAIVSRPRALKGERVKIEWWNACGVWCLGLENATVYSEREIAEEAIRCIKAGERRNGGLTAPPTVAAASSPL